MELHGLADLHDLDVEWAQLEYGTDERAVLRRLDHAAIFVLIAGSYTPIALIAMQPDFSGWGWTLFGVVWGIAIAGLVFGECTDCDPGDGYGSLTIEQILDDHIRPLGIPAYRGAMIGHIRQQFIVPVGGKVELDADAGTFRLLEPVFQG